MTDRVDKTDFQAKFTGRVPDFALGQVYGLRQWTLGHNFRLGGHFTGQWDTSGVNLAECKRYVYRRAEHRVYDLEINRYVYSYSEILPDLLERAEQYRRNLCAPEEAAVWLGISLRENFTEMDDYTRHFGTSLWVNGRTQPYAIKRIGRTFLRTVDVVFNFNWSTHPEPHPVAHPDCTCGFYAYWDLDALAASASLHELSVFGVVSGYGEVTEGTLGFRASKSKIVALSDPYVNACSAKINYTFRSGDRLSSLVPADADTSLRFRDSLPPGGPQVLGDLSELVRYAQEAGFTTPRPSAEDE